MYLRACGHFKMTFFGVFDLVRIGWQLGYLRPCGAYEMAFWGIFGLMVPIRLYFGVS